MAADPIRLVRLRDWAHKYRYSEQVMQDRGRIIDIDRFVRRLLRLRAGLVGILPQTRPGEVRDLLAEQGITAEMLPDDLAEFAGLGKALLGFLGRSTLETHPSAPRFNVRARDRTGGDHRPLTVPPWWS